MSRSANEPPEVLVFYHYFHPDDVVSARHLTDLATGLAGAGCRVEAMPCNRACRSDDVFPRQATYRGVRITRLYRPGLRQSSIIGRLVNLTWMLCAWSLVALRRRPDVVIVGTDPILSVLVALPWKLIRPRTRILHWCFDLYPDAAEASGMIRPGGLVARLVRRLTAGAYNRCDLVADIGECMRRRLPAMHATQVTLTPWALTEPSAPLPVDQAERQRIFGDTSLAILYSGNFGEAHAFERVLAMARQLRGRAVFAFSIRGNRVADLQAAVTAEDDNIRFVDFAEEAKLAARLACADLHLVTLRSGWEGIVVPSKFFGALAIGRPILFDGPVDSAIAGWIREHGVGILIEDLHPDAPLPDRQHCWQVYQDQFSYRQQLEGWKAAVRGD